jgi:transposase
MRYSNDTRKIAIKLLKEDGKSIDEVSKLLNIYSETLETWLAKYEAGDLFEIKLSTGRPREYDYEGLKEFVNNNSDLTLEEINQQYFQGSASTSGIDDALKRLKITFKKSPLIQRAR